MDNSDFQHYNRSERYVREIKKIYQALIKEVSGLMALGKIDLEKPFSFSDYPHLAKQFDEIFRFYAENITLKIESYKGKEWRYGEVKAYQSAGVEVPKIKIPPVRPPKELSERVWKHLSQYKGELELGLDLSIGKGKSANEIARDLKQYLNEPDRLFRRVRDKHGNLHLSKNAQNYHPGQGVYRSSFKNAQRLARTETNRAYHEASWRKYQEWDFVVGYEVRLSNNPKHCPFCSAMAGKYPKEFKFFGWHPNCRCTTIPILAKDIDDVLESEKITELPKPMRDWLNDNADKIEKAKNKPWLVVENGEFLGKINKREQAKSILLLDREKQFRTLFESKNGGKVLEHRLVKQGEDYSDIVKVANAFAKQGKIVEIMPEIYKTERTIRNIIFPNLQSKTSNPDLKIGNKYYDVKRPSSIRNIEGNANKASKQGAIAIISDSRLDKELTERMINERIKNIFKNKYYKYNTIYIHLKEELRLFNRTGGR